MTRPRCPSRSAQLVPALYRTDILHFTVDAGCFALYLLLTGWKHAVPRIGNGRESPRCLITLGSHWVADQFEPETMAAEDPDVTHGLRFTVSRHTVYRPTILLALLRGSYGSVIEHALLHKRRLFSYIPSFIFLLITLSLLQPLVFTHQNGPYC